MMQDKTFSFPADVRYHHSRLELADGSLSPTGGATIAYYIDHDENRIVGALSLCSDKDVFSKETGRAYALDRLTLRMNNKSVRDGSDLPLSVEFDTNDLQRWVLAETTKHVDKFVQSMSNSIYKTTAIPAPVIEAPVVRIGDYQVGFLINKLSDYFATYHKGV